VCALQLAFKIAIITITINKLLQHFQFLTPMPLSVSYDIRLNTVLKGIWSKNRKQVQQSSNHSSQSKSVLCKRIRKIPKSLIANIIFNVCLQLVE